MSLISPSMASDFIYLEKNSLNQLTIDSLKLIGHQIKERERSPMGHVNAIYVGEKIEKVGGR